MGNFRNYWVLLLSVLITTYTLPAQDSRQAVENLYELLQSRDHGPNKVAALTSGINWREVSASNSVDHRNVISFPAVMENRWSGLEFRDLDFKEVTKDEIRVTGTVSGRQHSECEYISSKFTHSWSLRDGKIVQFLEEF